MSFTRGAIRDLLSSHLSGGECCPNSAVGVFLYRRRPRQIFPVDILGDKMVFQRRRRFFTRELHLCVRYWQSGNPRNAALAQGCRGKAILRERCREIQMLHVAKS